MITIGVISRGKYGRRLIENISSNSLFKVSAIELPDKLPDFIEDPEEFVDKLKLDQDFFSNSLIISYLMHPDLTPVIIRIAAKNGARALIIAGEAKEAGGIDEIEKLAKKYEIHVEIHDICCEMSKSPSETISEFCVFFGKPDIEIAVKNGIVSQVSVIRGAPCGSTWHMAKGLIGEKVDSAPARGGLLVQQYPCRAVRGTRGGIHRAGNLHKEAVENALKEGV